MTYSHHRLDIYEADVYFAATPKQWKRMCREIKSKGGKHPPKCMGMSEFRTWIPGDGGAHVPVIVLWIAADRCRTTTELVNTIAHEATHATGQILDHIGHDGLRGDEPRAYLTGWLTSWMWDHTPARVRGIAKAVS